MCSSAGGCGNPPNQCGCSEHGPRIEGFIIPCLLLLLKEGPAHGYEFMEKLLKLTFLRAIPDPGVIYRHLRRLEEEGVVESRLEPSSGGPARKVYSLTSEGESYLQAWATSINNLKVSLENFLAAYEQYFPSK
ncbi:MAG: PadR family transcriptional regulator [Eubacteriales bacterium]